MDKMMSRGDMGAAAETSAQIMRGEMNLRLFLKQFDQLSSMGPMSEVMGMLPGMQGAQKALGGAANDAQVGDWVWVRGLEG